MKSDGAALRMFNRIAEEMHNLGVETAMVAGSQFPYRRHQVRGKPDGHWNVGAFLGHNQIVHHVVTALVSAYNSYTTVA